MTRVIELATDDAMPAIEPGGVTPIDPADRRGHAPDRHLLIRGEAGTLAARASCWWVDTPPLAGERVGFIGHYAAVNAASGSRALGAACATLERSGCTVAIGPVDGSTWRRYRWIVERGSDPPFFLEPDNPDSAPLEFATAGFHVLATYVSALTEDLTAEDPRLPAAQARLARQGVSIRPLDAACGRDELRAIYRLSIAAFSNNYLYTPIAEDEFLEQNERVLPHVDPELVLMAERDGQLVGYLFAIPDLLQRMRGEPLSTLIIKTVAVASGSGHAGLGSVLVGLAQQRAHARGYRRAIHALMHERNVSRNISRRYARTMRRYALFSRRLEAARS